MKSKSNDGHIRQPIWRDQLVTIADLEIFKHSLLEDLKLIMRESSGQTTKQWLRSSKVRKMLGISHGTLQTLRINRILPFTKIGGIVFYRYDDIERMLNDQRSKWSAMDKYEQLTCFLSRITSDSRMKPVHISLSLAICNLWILNHLHKSVRVSRAILMRASRIRSNATYHKTLKDLQMYGYVQYSPSYHPLRASQLTIVFDTNIIK